jgi:ABC-2 type transport system ATP-binding protein
LRAEVTVTTREPDVLLVHGLTAEQIGTAAWEARLPVFELTPQSASLEEAFMKLTHESVEYRSGSLTAAVAS